MYIHIHIKLLSYLIFYRVPSTSIIVLPHVPQSRVVVDVGSDVVVLAIQGEAVDLKIRGFFFLQNLSRKTPRFRCDKIVSITQHHQVLLITQHHITQ
jgi:hypothetical protein